VAILVKTHECSTIQRSSFTQRRKEDSFSLRLCELCVRLLFLVTWYNPYPTGYFDPDGLVYNGEISGLGTLFLQAPAWPFFWKLELQKPIPKRELGNEQTESVLPGFAGIIRRL